MSEIYILSAILVMAGVTVLLRFLPFLIFGGRAKTPEFIEYLGKVLPYAIMGMLVVYCLKGTSFDTVINWLPACVGVVLTEVIQIWKRNTIYSILVGTVVYMVLIRIM